MTKKTKINIFSENIHKTVEVDEKKAINKARQILSFYLGEKGIFNLSCLAGFDFNCISFDILYCGSEKTHEINKEYRGKDCSADIITFAIFADSGEKFVFDGEINLGEIIISLDKVLENALEKDIDFEEELHFLISHGIMHLLGFDHQTNEEYNFVVNAQTLALGKYN
ncbi:MAG: rRNA maturation RNase YbeY [Candidatus Gastranaerophilaceae bacterium]